MMACRGSDQAEAYFKAAEKAEKAGDTLNAYLLYSRAAALEPRNLVYAAKKASLRLATNRSFREELGPDPAGVNSETPRGKPGLSAEADDGKLLLPPPQLSGSEEKKSFNLKGDAKTIFEQVAGAYGIQVVFEADYQSPPPFSFRLNDATAEEALRGLEMVSNSFLIPLNPSLALVSRDNDAKRKDHMAEVAATIPIPAQLSAQDTQEILTAVKSALDIRRANLDPTHRQVILRDEAGKVMAAQRLFAMLSQVRPQIEVDLEFVEVDKTSALGYGISLPNQISVVNFVGSVALPGVFSSLEQLTGANTPLALGIGNATVLATLARASATTLLDAQVVTVDGQPATMHIGERYPIATNQYVGNTAGLTGTVYTPPPTITFEDLGLVLKITASIHEDQEITLDLESQFKTLGAVSPVAGIPVINNRSYNAKGVRLQEGEWAVLAGLVQLNDSEVRSGIAGLYNVPILGKLFAQNNIEHDSTRILLFLKPHIIALPSWETLAHTIWVGTETRPVSVF